MFHSRFDAFSLVCLKSIKKHIKSAQTHTRKYDCSIFGLILKPKNQKQLTLSSPSLAAVSKVSGCTAALPARRRVLAAIARLRHPPCDQQRETRRPVPHRHPENQEAAVRTSAAMMLPATGALWMPLSHYRHDNTQSEAAMVTKDVHIC